jgi:hypothetical protein
LNITIRTFEFVELKKFVGWVGFTSWNDWWVHGCQSDSGDKRLKESFKNPQAIGPAYMLTHYAKIHQNKGRGWIALDMICFGPLSAFFLCDISWSKV